MKSRLQLMLLLLASVVFATTHYLALTFSLYYLFPWFDIPMHLLGGAIVALMYANTAWCGFTLPPRFTKLVPTLAFVLIIGLLWEIFEIWIGIPLIEKGFERDIWFDLFNDLVGGAVGWFIATRITKLES